MTGSAPSPVAVVLPGTTAGKLPWEPPDEGELASPRRGAGARAAPATGGAPGVPWPWPTGGEAGSAAAPCPPEVCLSTAPVAGRISRVRAGSTATRS